MLAFRSVQQSNHCVVYQVMVDGCVRHLWDRP
jgi:hypothetical protein